MADAPTRPNTSPSSIDLVDLLTIGGGSVAATFARLLQGPRTYWISVALHYVCISLLIFELHRKARGRPFWRGLVIVAGAGVALVYSVYFVFVSTVLNVSASSGLGNFRSGSIVDGIEWRPEYAELRVVFENPTTNDFENLDFEFWVADADEVGDHIIGGVGQDATTGKCEELGFAEAVEEARSFLKEPGKPPTDVIPMSMAQRTGAIRMRCGRLNRGRHLAFSLAIMRPVVERLQGRPPRYVVTQASKRPVSKIRTRGTYLVLGREISIAERVIATRSID